MSAIFTVPSRHDDLPIIGTSAYVKSWARDLVLFDRDDTLIHDIPGRVRSVSDVAAIPGAIEALQRLSQSNCSVGVVSNQSSVGRGLISLDQLVEIMEYLGQEVFRGLNGKPLFHFWIVCPHRPDTNCCCRKPKPAMIRAALQMHSSLERAVLVGDQEVDARAAKAAGVADLRVSGTLKLQSIEAALARGVL